MKCQRCSMEPETVEELYKHTKQEHPDLWEKFMDWVLS